MKKRSMKLIAAPVALALVAAACGSDDDSDDAPADEPAEEPADEPAEEPADEPADDAVDVEGTAEILVTGPERAENEAGALQQVLGQWGEDNGIEVTYL